MKYPASRFRHRTAQPYTVALLVIAALLFAVPVPAVESGLDPELSDIPITPEAITSRKELLKKFTRQFELVPTPTEYGPSYNTPYCRALLKAFETQQGIEHKLPMVSVRGLNDPKLREYLPSCRETSGYYYPHGGYVATPFYKLWRIEASKREAGALGDYLLLEESFFQVYHFDIERTVGAAKYLQLDPKKCGARDLHLTVREYVPPPPPDLPVPIRRDSNLSLHGVVAYNSETLFYRLLTVPLLPNPISGRRDNVDDRLIVYRFDATRPNVACMYRVKPD